MRGHVQICVLTVIVSLLFSGDGVSQQADADRSRLDAAIKLLKADHPGVRIEMNEKSGLPRSIHNLVPPFIGLNPAPTVSLDDVDRIVEQFFTTNAALFLQSGPSSSVRIKQKRMDPQMRGRAVARVQQTVNGLDIYGAEAAVVVDLTAAEVETLTSSTFVIPPALEQRALTLSEEDAKGVAKNRYSAELAANPEIQKSETDVAGREPAITSKRIVFDPATLKKTDSQPQLTYQIRIGTFVYFISAKDGSVLYRFRDFASAKSRLTYDVANGSQLPGVLILNESGAVTSAAIPEDVKLAHEFAGTTYDYYFKKFHRDSYDNANSGGSSLISSVRYMQMHNAYWSKDSKQMVYGPGYAVSLSVVGHEIAHGVITVEADLQYTNESGAANEAFADFFGVMVAASQNAMVGWKIGEAIPGFSVDHPLRNMADPHNGGFDPEKPFNVATNQGQPDSYAELVIADKPICATTTDSFNGCVHFNSGILNKAWYLIATGGSGSRSDIKVSGIGKEKLEQILYRTLTTKLTSVSAFADVATGSLEACDDLASQGYASIAKANCDSLRDGYRAVGISSN